jgi:hypothetical protein
MEESKMNVESLAAHFDAYILQFIEADIQREIDLARSGKGGGNLLAALGLLCYTEFLGGLKRAIFAHGEARKNFDAFFQTLGPAYQELATKVNVYDVFRCGMAHEYLVKQACTVAMLNGEVEPPCGIVETSDRRYVFIVEKYFRDLMVAARALRAQLVPASSPAAS